MAAELLETLRALQSNDNALRNAAEKRFEEAKAQQAAQTVAALFQVLGQQQVEEPLRESAAVLLRQCLNKAVADENAPWTKLGAGQAECKAQLLLLLEAEPQSKVRRKIADAVQHLGNQLIDISDGERPQNIQAWPEILPTLMRLIMDTTKDAGVRADALWAVKELQGSLWPVMVANSQQTSQVLQASLGDANEPVRAGAASLFCNLLDNLTEKQDQCLFVALVEPLAAVVKSLADSADTKYVNEVLQNLQATEESTDCFKDHIGTHFLPLLCPIAKLHKQDETRRLALEVLITFAQSRPKAMVKVPGFIQQCLDACVSFLFEADPDVDSWAAQEDDDEDDDGEENVSAGEQGLDRLCSSLNQVQRFGPILETLKPVIATLFQGGEWKQVFAGVKVLATIAEYVDDEETVKQMLGAIKAQLKASHVRVRHAAWAAVAQFSQDHSDVLAGDALAPGLLQDFLIGLDDPCSRILQCCMEAFQYFGENVERDLIEPVLQPMMEKLGLKLPSSTLPVQKKVITFIAVLAGQVEDGFAPYYGSLMPMLKQLVQTVLHKAEERTLLGKLFECISLLANANKEGFKADAQVIMEAMIVATQVPNLPSNDPVKEYMMSASERICTTMKADFLPFVPHLLPSVLEKFALAPKEISEGNIPDNLEESEVVLEQDGDKIKIMAMSTSEMEDLKNALDCVHTFVENLGKTYLPFVQKTAEALLPVFDFSINEEIRDTAFETWGLLCGVMQENGDTQTLNQLVMEFIKRILPKIQDTTIMDIEAQKTRASGIVSCLTKAGPSVLTSDQVLHICQVALKALADSINRRDEAQKGKTSKPAAEDEDVDAEDETEDEVELRIACVQVTGALMQHHPDFFITQGLQTCVELVQRCMLPTSCEDDRRLGIYTITQMLKHLGQRVTAQWPLFMPQLLQDITHKQPELRQPACYAISLAASNPAFAEVATATATRLSELIVETRRRPKKKSEKPAQACADNALSGLLEILRHHSQVVGGAVPQLWSVWLQGLPIQEDEAEGHINHKALLELVQSERPEVVGEAGANLPHIVSVLVDVYKTEMSADDVSNGIGQLILKLGQARLEQLAASLKEKQQKKLLRIYKEAQQPGK